MVLADQRACGTRARASLAAPRLRTVAPRAALALLLWALRLPLGAADAADATPSADQTLLQTSVTVAWINARPREALEAIDAVLAPGPQVRWDPHAPELGTTRSTFTGSGVPLGTALAALTPPGWRAAVVRRVLTLAQTLPDDAAGSMPPERTSGILRRRLLAWVHDGCTADLDVVLREGATRTAEADLPLGVLAHDERIQGSVGAALDRLLRPDAQAPLAVVQLAAALAQPRWAPALDAQLRTVTTALEGMLPAQERARCWQRQERLIAALGACSPGPPATIALLARIAAVPLLDMKEREGDRVFSFASVLGLDEEEQPALVSGWAALDALGRIGTPAAQAALTRLCQPSPAQALTWGAAATLAQAGAADAVGPVQAALAAALRPDAEACWANPTIDDDAITASATAVGDLAGAAGRRAVLDLLARPERRPVLLALRQCRDPAIVPAMLTLLHREPTALRQNEDARMGAMLGLDVEAAGALTEQPGATAALLARLQAPDVVPAEAQTLLLCLGATRSAAALPLLTARATPPTDEATRTLACLALACTAQPDALGIMLQRAQQDPAPGVRTITIIALRQLLAGLDRRILPTARTQVRAVLDRLLAQDPEAQVRQAVLTIDSGEIDAAHVRLWTERLLTDPSPEVQRLLVRRIGWICVAPQMASRTLRNRCLAALALAPTSNAQQQSLERWWSALGGTVDTNDLRRRVLEAAGEQGTHDAAALEAATARLDLERDRLVVQAPIHRQGR